MAERKLSVSAILCCCGGGGLSAGIATAMAATNPGVTLYTAEPEGFDDTARSLSLGERVANETEQGSICDAIVTPTPGEIPSRSSKHWQAEDLLSATIKHFARCATPSTP